MKFVKVMVWFIRELAKSFAQSAAVTAGMIGGAFMWEKVMKEPITKGIDAAKRKLSKETES